ncbi:thiamine pyrophosphate-dependent dehydrogenase E1 component subunit alpha [Candidatus Woesearchaeota archaeon]|nr:thiamine pyrophosphate-dependent dehydrogenase E1 component subunit alpha [Candidatus Woesearchaeota archaeon]
MPQKTIQKFQVDYLQILDEHGTCDEKLKPKELTPPTIKKLYRLMVLARMFDEKMLSLQRQGRLFTFAQSKGQEAADIGSTWVLGKDDWMVQYNAGDERGMQLPKGTNCFPVCIPVATQVPHAVGFAWAAKLKKEKTVVLCYLGDGATSEGACHEAMNFAGVFKVPVIFVCENNQWAISVPRSHQTASETIAQKAIAYGIDGIQVDGNDLFAMTKATKDAISNAKKGTPTLIEAYTYRLGDHTTSDDAKKYRSDKELESWKKKDPITRVRLYLEKKKLWDKQQEGQLYKDVQKEVEDAVKLFEAQSKPDPNDIFDYMYAEHAPEFDEQRQVLK